MMIPTTGGFSAEGDAVLMGLGCITRSYYGNAKSVFARGSPQPDSRLRNILFLRALIQVFGGFHGVPLVLEVSMRSLRERQFFSWCPPGFAIAGVLAVLRSACSMK